MHVFCGILLMDCKQTTPHLVRCLTVDRSMHQLFIYRGNDKGLTGSILVSPLLLISKGLFRGCPIYNPVVFLHGIGCSSETSKQGSSLLWACLWLQYLRILVKEIVRWRIVDQCWSGCKQTRPKSLADLGQVQNWRSVLLPPWHSTQRQTIKRQQKKMENKRETLLYFLAEEQ